MSLRRTSSNTSPPPRIRDRLRALFRRIVAWFHVEHHGKYSVERLVELYVFSTTRTSTRDHAQSLLLLLSTPLPPLLLNGLIDMIPLCDPINHGGSNIVFWVRLFLVGTCLARIMFDHFRTFIPELKIKMTAQYCWLLSCTVGGVSVLYDVAMSSRIGFPLPFVLLFSTPVFMLMFWVGMLSVWWRELMTSKVLRMQMKHTYVIVVIQFSLMVIYPAFNHFFSHASGVAQTAMALLLPLMKMTARSVFSYALKFQNEDMRPDVVVFNAEVFHALFNSFCLQSSTSTATTVLLTCVDALETVVSVCSIDSLVAELRSLDAKVDSQRSVVLKSTAVATQIPFIEHALQYVIHLEGQQNCLVSRGRRTVRLLSRKSSSMRTIATSVGSQVHPVAEVLTIERAPAFLTQRSFKADRSSKYLRQSRLDSAEMALMTRLRVIASNASTREQQVREDTDALSTLPLKDQRKYIKGALQLFHVADFILLASFAEIVVAVMYAGYLTAVYYLPNQKYYLRISTMTETQLAKTVGSVLLYAIVDLVSFAFVCVSLKRKLGISPLHQLAFVVRKQWRFVQSRFMLGMLFAMSSTLIHFGVDYSFTFAWLKQGH